MSFCIIKIKKLSGSLIVIFSSFGFILLTLSLHPVFTAGSPTPCCVSQRVKSDSALTNTAQSPIYFVNIFAKTKLFAKHFGANVGSIHEINKKYKKSRNTVPLIHYREPRKIKLNFIPEITDMSEILKALKKIKVDNKKTYQIRKESIWNFNTVFTAGNSPAISVPHWTD